MQEAENSTRRLCALVEAALNTNQELAERIRGLEREGSIIAETTAGRDDVSTIRQTSASKTVSFIETDRLALKFTFDQDLQASRVYIRAVQNRQSMTSLTSTALYTTALSVFSNLSLSQGSNLSFYALPIYSLDLSTSHCYIFGEEGAMHSIEEDGRATQPIDESKRPEPRQRLSKSRAPRTAIDSAQSQPPPGLLGRFARRRKLPVSSAPAIPVLVTHVNVGEGGEYKVGTMSPFCREM